MTQASEGYVNYDGERMSISEYDEMRARKIAEDVRDALDDLTLDLKLAVEYKPFKTLKTVLENMRKDVDLLDDVVNGAKD